MAHIVKIIDTDNQESFITSIATIKKDNPLAEISYSKTYWNNTMTGNLVTNYSALVIIPQTELTAPTVIALNTIANESHNGSNEPTS